jgi:hypothetical protein
MRAVVALYANVLFHGHDLSIYPKGSMASGELIKVFGWGDVQYKKSELKARISLKEPTSQRFEPGGACRKRAGPQSSDCHTI